MRAWDFFVSTGPVARAVLVLLLACSVGSWAIILKKFLGLRRSKPRDRQVLAFLEKRVPIETLQKDIAWIGECPTTLLVQAIFEKAPSKNLTSIQDVERLNRVISAQIDLEINRQSRYLHILATIGNTAPFVGLFGTVWGIMKSFQEIGRQGTANIAAVAPGIAEALIATATGLAVAIPAVVAYNLFVHEVNQIDVLLRGVADEISNRFERPSVPLPSHSLPRTRG